MDSATRAADTGALSTLPAPFDAVQAVADAVLYEGYLLYPYRRSSSKNRVRWQFGVLAPRRWVAAQRIPDPGVAGSAESWFSQVECLAEGRPEATLTVRLRFLRLQRRQLFVTTAERGRRPVEELTDGRHTQTSFEEAVPQQVEGRFAVEALLGNGTGSTGNGAELPIELAANHTVQTVCDDTGRVLGELERSSEPLHARLMVTAVPAEAPFPLLRLGVRVENLAEPDDPGVDRERVLPHCLIATHLLLGLDQAHFLSALDPPAWAAAAAAACSNRHLFPVLAGPQHPGLAGPRDGAEMMLCSPIILYDYPEIAPESPGDLHDAAEIDEILSLRTLTLTDAEKQEARTTDPRAAEIVDRVEAMPAEMLAKLHGAVRALRPLRPDNDQPADELPWWHPQAEAAVNPERDTMLVAGRPVSRGTRVRLRPRGHGSDAHDMFLAGRVGRVHAVLHDVDGSVRVAVTVEGDPAAELHEWYGRFFHFGPDEIEPLDGAGERP